MNVWVKPFNPCGFAEVKSISNPLYQFTFLNEDTLRGEKRVPVDFNDSRVVSHRLSAKPLNARQPKLIQSKQGRIHTIRTPGPNGETNIYGNGSSKKEGLDLKIQRQAISPSTKLWKLLSRYNIELDNAIRSWASFASHCVLDPQTQRPKIDPEIERRIRNDSSISLESWHDYIHGFVETGNGYEGHMGDPAIAGV